MARRVQLIAIAVALVVPAPARASGFLAGAATIDSTPPAAGTSAGALADKEFGPSASSCPKSLYPDEGLFALQEPTGPGGYCDANANGRRDQLYADNGKGAVTGVHDPLEVRAFAISDGNHRPVVYASVDQIGIFDYYTEAARADLIDTYKVNADLVVSADHNESSPDSIGLYGAYAEFEGIGIRSGIDEYYMRFLEDRIARAAADAVHNMQPANLYALQVEGKLPPGASGDHYPLLAGHVAAHLRPVSDVGGVAWRRSRRRGRHEIGCASGAHRERNPDLHRDEPRRPQPGDGERGHRTER